MGWRMDDAACSIYTSWPHACHDVNVAWGCCHGSHSRLMVKRLFSDIVSCTVKYDVNIMAVD